MKIAIYTTVKTRDDLLVDGLFYQDVSNERYFIRKSAISHKGHFLGPESQLELWKRAIGEDVKHPKSYTPKQTAWWRINKYDNCLRCFFKDVSGIDEEGYRIWFFAHASGTFSFKIKEGEPLPQICDRVGYLP